MYYEAELDYLLRVLKKMRVQAAYLTVREIIELPFDLGLRRFLGQDTDYGLLVEKMTEIVKNQTVYKATDQYLCSYIFLGFPQRSEGSVLMVGPYLSREVTEEWMLEAAERFGLPVRKVQWLKKYYAGIPVVQDATPIMNMVSTFAETLWGTDSPFEILMIDQEVPHLPADVSDIDTGRDMMIHMNLMEARYAHENEMMEIVSKGQTRKVELMMSGFTQALFEQRLPDPVRNLKNYSIICNTLMRKAAERGGVHPVHLDRTSSEYASRIEQISDFESGYALMRDMARGYCRLVRKYATAKYSPPVQKAVICIRSDLTGDLSLNALARMQNISANYLSALFHRETGKTVTDFVNETRMEAAARLLLTTRLQVQTVAQHCGMSDVNYFSKLFRRYYGVAPRQFRESGALTGR